jgi:tetratricopeptide (TPR) repeat protein
VETFRALVSTLQRPEMSSISFGVTPLAIQFVSYLSWSLAELGQFTEAIRLAEQSLRNAQTVDQPYGLITACMGLGMVHVRQGDAAAAIAPLELGLKTALTFGLTAFTFHGVAASLGGAYALMDRSDEAVTLLRKVADQALSMKAISDHLIAAIPLGHVLLTTGHIDEAAAVAGNSLELARQHHQHGHVAHALRLLGAAFAVGGDALLSAKNFLQAIDVGEELGMLPLVAHCHAGLA